MGKPNAEGPSGCVLLHKQPGFTSFESLYAVKRAFKGAKTGHAGTLDKFASGLLIVLVGRAVKLTPWFSGCGKEYRGIIRFGVETDTLDPEGSPVAQAPVPSREAVASILPQFTGRILQAPPAYSAVHVDGKRAYALARSGEAPRMKPRPVSVSRLELRSWDPPLAEIFVQCSSGTYIRSLARDIALAAGSRGHLAALTRTRAAEFRLEDAAPMDESAIAAALKPIDREITGALGLPCINREPEDLAAIIRGKPLDTLLDGIDPVPAAALFCGDQFAAIAESADGRWRYGCVYAQPGGRQS
ncbi:MAG: tRNA pseudouridine(55) synthase TruB [Treponema sp.]|jgi:tRNA pseudouridine55 synthase|nr:tRNA pseudouridine(55) synthase TruB [Treponema sp.]